MPHYEIITPLSFETGKPPKTGTIEMDADDAASLVAVGALRLLPDAPELDASELDASELDASGSDELQSKTVAELTELAKAEGVNDVPEKAKKDVLIAAIEAHRLNAGAANT